MKRLIVIAIITCVSLNACLGADRKSGTETAPVHAAAKYEYSINDKPVTMKAFEDFLAALKERTGTWFCAETSTGGITGYDAVDWKGVVYEVRRESDSGNVRGSIRKKVALE